MTENTSYPFSMLKQHHRAAATLVTHMPKSHSVGTRLSPDKNSEQYSFVHMA